MILGIIGEFLNGRSTTRHRKAEQNYFTSSSIITENPELYSDTSELKKIQKGFTACSFISSLGCESKKKRDKRKVPHWLLPEDAYLSAVLD